MCAKVARIEGIRSRQKKLLLKEERRDFFAFIFSKKWPWSFVVTHVSLRFFRKQKQIRFCNLWKPPSKCTVGYKFNYDLSQKFSKCKNIKRKVRNVIILQGKLLASEWSWLICPTYVKSVELLPSHIFNLALIAN